MSKIGCVDTLDVRFAGVISKCKDNGITQKELADAVGLCIVAFRKREKDPSLFTLKEINGLFDYLNIPSKERAYVLYGVTA